MSESPLLSIITINLNNLGGLKKTMKSIFDQTWADFEYIVIDGGSKDGSKEYIESQDKNINMWISEGDNGVYNAMNKGISLARGKYLYFLNSGDWFPNSAVLQAIHSSLSGNDLLYGNLVKVYQDKNVVDKGPSGSVISLYTFYRYNINHQAAFISHELFKKYGYYDENLKIVSDWKFFLISLGLNAGTVSYIDEDICCYPMDGISSDIAGRDMEKKKVLEEYIPVPVLLDLRELKRLKNCCEEKKLKQLEELEKNIFGRKLLKIYFKLFKFLR